MKKITIRIFFTLSCFCATAADIRVLITDRDLEIPLEGVRLTLTGITGTYETDQDGVATLSPPADFTRGTLTAQLGGYENKKAQVTAEQTDIILYMQIADVIEGKELVVERKAPGKTDAKSGISVVMEKSEMKTTAQIGLVEDIMASVSTLPGVGFSGGWNSQPSIRGGYPEEMGTVLDGVYIISPWHWGGAYSIFNPLMVDSVKMSHGIFSARYGRAMSGLLEVTTIKPTSSFVRIDAGIATTSTDFFAQIPFTPKAGLFTGGKVTYMETLGWAVNALPIEPKLSDTVSQMPYIRDFYAKGYYTPVPSLDISLNAFFGSDGIGIKTKVSNEGITTAAKFDWLNLQGFAGTNIKWMPTDNTLVHFVGAYNQHVMNAEFAFDPSGSYTYSDSFLDTYDLIDGSDDRTINGFTSYSIDSLGMEGFMKTTIHQGQAKLESDILMKGGSIVSFGTEEVLQFAQSKQKVTGWQEQFFSEIPQYAEVTYEQNIDGNRILNSALFALWSFGTDSSPIRGELGLRGEHFYLWNDNFDLNTIPVANPRLTVQWTPIKETKYFNAITLSAGTGFYSMFPLDVIGAEKKYGINSFEVGPNRAWFQVVGAELDLKNDWYFKTEGYYKQYFNRLYLVADNSKTPVEYKAKTDGIGYATGFDLMLEKKNGRRLDGYLSYSFVIARYQNPTKPAYDNHLTMSGEPLDTWFYPNFHRFHTLNLIINWKPITGMVFTVKSSLATSTPKNKVGEITVYAATLPDGRILERYSRTEVYSDTLRTELSCPVDVRFGYSNYYRGTKLKWEYYIGAENVFVNLYSPKNTPGFDAYTGKEMADSGSADFNIGIPLVSVGYKISY